MPSFLDLAAWSSSQEDYCRQRLFFYYSMHHFISPCSSFILSDARAIVVALNLRPWLAGSPSSGRTGLGAGRSRSAVSDGRRRFREPPPSEFRLTPATGLAVVLTRTRHCQCFKSSPRTSLRLHAQELFITWTLNPAFRAAAHRKTISQVSQLKSCRSKHDPHWHRLARFAAAAT